MSPTVDMALLLAFEFWTWLTENAVPVTALATVVLVAVTTVYVISTGQAAKSAAKAAEAAERQVRLQTMPYLVPSSLRLFVNDAEFFEVEVRLKNDGAGVALNVAAAVAYFRQGFDDREQTPLTHLQGSISPGAFFPPEQAQRKSWVLPSAQHDRDSWTRAVDSEDYGVVVICSDATDSWLEFVHWKARNRTEVKEIPKPADADYQD